MYCPLKLPFFIKKCPSKLRNLLYILICNPSLNYHFSLKKCSLKLQNLFYIFMCINTFCQDIDVQQTVLYPKIFSPYEWTSVFYYNLRTRSAYDSGVSSSRHDTKLNFVPVVPRVKELESVTLTSSRGNCINYRPEASF